MDSTDLANQISEIIFTKKGFNVLKVDLRNLVTFTDYFVICSADSDTQVKAIADQIIKFFPMMEYGAGTEKGLRNSAVCY